MPNDMSFLDTSPSDSQSESALFQPVQIGEMNLSHRVVLSPLTRFRATDEHVPLPHVAQYYSQRGSVPGTFLISEATFIAKKAGGYANAPGIWSDEQIEAWKTVTTAVHEKKSFIYLQLWALGRGAFPAQLEAEGVLDYVSASSIPIPSPIRPATDPAPRALSIPEIKEYTSLYAQAAENAIERAGFDGVEIHGANGFLIDQFLQDVTNQRTDEYGGSVENRARFALEVLDAVVQQVGAKRTGLKLSPWSPHQGMGMADPVPTFAYLIQEIRRRHPDLAYLHATEKRLNPLVAGQMVAAFDEYTPEGTENDFIREIWTAQGGKLITAGGYTRETGIKVADGKGDLVAYGRPFIANPDLPYRLRKGLPLAKGDRNLYYVRGSLDPKGYTDYPISQSEESLILPQEIQLSSQ